VSYVNNAEVARVSAKRSGFDDTSLDQERWHLEATDTRYSRSAADGRPRLSFTGGELVI